MAKYVIWDEVSDVFTPAGEVFTAEQWLDKYPMARHSKIDLVVAGDSAINGAFCQEYTSLVSIFAQQGCDFTGCVSKQDHLDRIEEFEIERNTPPEPDPNYVSDETRTADALEDLVVLTELAQQ